VSEFIHNSFLIIGILASLGLLYLSLQQYLTSKKQFLAKPVITAFEKRMFIRLKEVLPQQHILAQVAFSALITSDDYKIRQKFNRKVTDFVVLNTQFEVIAIIELDDPTHLYKEEEDRQRDAMLKEAGYRIIRYTEIPTIRQLRKDIL